MLSAPFGVAYIETRFEVVIGAYATANVIAEHWPGHDPAIVAAFGDASPALRPTAGQAERRALPADTGAAATLRQRMPRLFIVAHG